MIITVDLADLIIVGVCVAGLLICVTVYVVDAICRHRKRRKK